MGVRETDTITEAAAMCVVEYKEGFRSGKRHALKSQYIGNRDGTHYICTILHGCTRLTVTEPAIMRGV